ncbi:MAG: polyphosphate polymerase domain-containing protein [Flavipsychrobacter sp.]|nr:polyphosphate polymerase domain-containing protein [Flavipsychrobacter sp.]
MTEYLREVQGVLQQAETISLEEMDSVKLLNRIDRKYVMHISRLPEIMRNILGEYRVLDINGTRLFSYNTIYFDTPGHQFYKDHHNGLNNRVKVRCRQYLDNNLSFFEIKKKYKGYRTDKYRKRVDNLLQELTEPEYAVVKEKYAKHSVEQLNLSLLNSFNRITFVSKALTERFTIDLSLQFGYNGDSVAVDKVVIIEVKQDKTNLHSAIIKELKAQRIPPGSISKYILGITLIKKDVKHNAFKMILSKINKIQNLYGTSFNGRLAGG